MTNFKKTALSLAVASTLAIAGCGGGSSGGSAGGSGGDQAVQVSGSAVKGILKSARVNVYELDNAGGRVSETPVGQTETDESGHYEVDLNDSYQGGLLEIEVTPIAGKTKMVCDASACGEVIKGQDLDVPEGFSLSSIAFKPKEGNKISAPVTAWSTMATKRTKALVGTTKKDSGESYSPEEAARRATAEVSLVAGFDIARTNARDITNLEGASDDEQKAAVMNAVIAEAIFAETEGQELDFAANLEKLTKVLEDGSLDTQDGELKTSLDAATAKVDADETIILSEAVQASLDSSFQKINDGTDASTSINDEFLSGDGANNIENFREFVAEVRAWASSIEQLDGDALTAAVNADRETIQNIFSSTTEGQFVFLGLTLDAVNEFILSSPEAVSAYVNNGGTETVTIVDDSGRNVGTASLAFANDNGLKINISGTAGETYEPINLTMNTSIPVSELDVVQHPDGDGSINLLVDSLQKANSIVLSGTIGTGLITLNELSLSLNLQEGISATVAGGLMDDPDGIDTKFSSAKLLGKATVKSKAGDVFTGQIDLALTRLTDIQHSALNASRMSLKSFSIAGAFDSADPNVLSFNASAALNVRNGAEFDVLSWAEYSSQSRWLDIAAGSEDLKFMDPSEKLAPVVPVVGVINADFGTEYSWASGEYFYEGGGSVFNQYYPGAEEQKALTESIIAKFREQVGNLTGTFQVVPDSIDSTFEPVEYQPVEISALSWSYAQFSYTESFSSFDLTLELDGLPQGFSGRLEYVTDAKVSNVAYVSRWDDSEPADIYIWEDSLSSSPIDFQSIYAEVDLGKYELTEGAQSRGFYLRANTWESETYYDGGVTYELLASRTDFDKCVVNPVTEIEKLTGWTYSSFSAEGARLECARNTLTEGWFNVVGSEMDVFGEDDIYLDLSGMPVAGDSLLEQSLGSDLYPAVTSQAYQARLIFGEEAAALTNPGSVSVLTEFPNLETADYFLNGSITVGAEVDLMELGLNTAGATTAKATVVLDRTSKAGGTVTADVTWNGGNYNAKVISENFETLKGVNVEFQNAEGYSLVLEPVFDENKELVDLTGKAMVNDSQVGTVALRNAGAGRLPVIEYNDGSEAIVETLF